jgi:hypothetical protein
MLLRKRLGIVARAVVTDARPSGGTLQQHYRSKGTTFSFLLLSALQDLLLGQQQETLSRQTGQQQQQQQQRSQQQQQRQERDPISLFSIAQQLLRQGGIATLHQKGLREFLSTVQQLSVNAVGASVPDLVQLVLETVPKLSEFIRDRKKKQRQKERNADKKGAEGEDEGTDSEKEEGEEGEQQEMEVSGQKRQRRGRDAAVAVTAAAAAGDGVGGVEGGGFTTASVVHQQQQQQHSGPSSSAVTAASGDTATAATAAGDSGVADDESSSDAGDESDAASDESSEPGEGVLPGAAAARPDVVSEGNGVGWRGWEGSDDAHTLICWLQGPLVVVLERLHGKHRVFCSHVCVQ